MVHFKPVILLTRFIFRDYLFYKRWKKQIVKTDNEIVRCWQNQTLPIWSVHKIIPILRFPLLLVTHIDFRNFKSLICYATYNSILIGFIWINLCKPLQITYYHKHYCIVCHPVVLYHRHKREKNILSRFSTYSE